MKNIASIFLPSMSFIICILNGWMQQPFVLKPARVNFILNLKHGDHLYLKEYPGWSFIVYKN